MSKKELKFGDWASVWNDNDKRKSKRRYIGFDGEVHWVITAIDEEKFKRRVFGETVNITCYEHAEPYELEVDWLQVSRNTKVLISNEGERWKEAYFCAYLECSKCPYLVFIDHYTGQYVSQDVATGAVGVKYCQFPKDFEIPKEWLKEDYDG